MSTSSSSKDQFFENVINPYLQEVMQHPQAIQMHEGVLHIRDVQGPKGTGTMEGRLEAMDQEVFRCKGMVEHGRNAIHEELVLGRALSGHGELDLSENNKEKRT